MVLRASVCAHHKHLNSDLTERVQHMTALVVLLLRLLLRLHAMLRSISDESVSSKFNHLSSVPLQFDNP